MAREAVACIQTAWVPGAAVTFAGPVKMEAMSIAQNGQAR